MLQLHHLTKSFPGVFGPALDDVCLTLEEGDFCAVIGANGSGKSTLMKVIAGEQPADRGELLIYNQPVPPGERYRYMASVVQDIHQGTVPEMTLLENMVLSHRRTHGGSLRFYAHHAPHFKHLIEAVGTGLEQYMHRPLGLLSGGQRQTIATIMAISSNPTLLLLDEHTSALDPAMEQALMAYTARSITEHGLTCLMVTHTLEDAILYGNRLVMLQKGRIVLDVGGEAKSSLNAEQLLHGFYLHVAEPPHPSGGTT